MIFIATASFPQTSVKQVAKIYGEMKKLPAAICRHGPYFQIETGKSIQVATVYETDAAVGHEIKKFLEKRYAVFGDLAGFSFRVEQWFNLTDAVSQLAKTPIAEDS